MALPDPKEGLYYGPESVIVKHGKLEVRTPVFPEPCSYVRVVRGEKELAYWTCEEWGPDDTENECMGAIMGAIKAVFEGTFREH